MAYLVGKLYRETKKERTDTLIQNAPIANCLPTGSTADRIAEQFNVSSTSLTSSPPQVIQRLPLLLSLNRIP
jgi:hypothetical protein